MTIQRARAGLLVILVLALLWVFVPNQHVVKVELPSDPNVVVRTKATMEEKRENKALVISYLRALGYNEQQRACAITLWTRESRLDHLADNPRSTAYGIAQLLGEKSGRADIQILHGIRYVEHRYSGSFCSALRHSDRRGWY